jgi:hypothetical protein
MATLELRTAAQARKDRIVRNLYGATDEAALRAASTKTDDEILSAQGEALISALQASRPPTSGTFHFSAVSPTAKTITVRTSFGYARLVNPDNTLGTNVGSATVTNPINITIPAGTGHRSYAIIATNSAGTASGTITTLSSTVADNRITAIALSSLTSCTSITLNNTQLTSFNGGTGLTACTYLNLNNNRLTSFNRGSGTSLSACTSLLLGGNPLTSFDSAGLTACTGLYLGYNQLTSFDASAMSSLYELFLNENASVLNSFLLHPSSFQSPDAIIEIISSEQNVNSINAILSALPTTPSGLGATINVSGNQGSLECNPALAPSDWTVITS